MSPRGRPRRSRVELCAEIERILDADPTLSDNAIQRRVKANRQTVQLLCRVLRHRKPTSVPETL
jgi:hypothetical protein